MCFLVKLSPYLYKVSTVLISDTIHIAAAGREGINFLKPNSLDRAEPECEGSLPFRFPRQYWKDSSDAFIEEKKNGLTNLSLSIICHIR